MDNQFNEVVDNIRSCLVSTKGQITLRQLEDDYRLIIGERIPFSRFGHNSIEAFLQTIPSIVVIRSNGQVYVDARRSDKSEHIAQMVGRQKEKTKKKSHVRLPHSYKPHFQRHRPLSKTTGAANKWRPMHTATRHADHRNDVRPPQNTARLTHMSHNQFVSCASPTVASKNVVGPQYKAPVPNQTLNNNRRDLDGIVSDPNCSFLGSTNSKKRITKLMNNMSLDRDSGNSSPTTDYSINLKDNYTRQFVQTGDAIADLAAFCSIHKLGEPEHKFTETKLKKAKQINYHCKITINQHTYLSYPDDSLSQAEAEQKASLRALNDLIAKYGNTNRKSLLISSNDDIIERIPPMLEKYNASVWMWQIEADYVDKYDEQLPSDWLKVIDSSNFVSIEKCPGGCVLKYCNPNDKGKKLDVSLNALDVTVPCNTVQFGDDNRLFGVVTAAETTEEVWCQNYATPESITFNKMLEAMNAYYKVNSMKHRPNSIHFGSCYAAFHDGAWTRVRALGATTSNQTDCFLIDFGEEVTYPTSNIYLLKREFALIEAQAFVCRLSGLEEFVEASIGSEHLAALIGRELIIEMVSEDALGDDITIPVVMYDLQTEESINEMLLTNLTFETAKTQLNKTSVNEVYVSNIESNGDVYVQVRSPGYFRLFELVNELEMAFGTRINPDEYRECFLSKTDSLSKMYLVNRNGHWTRCRIIAWSPINVEHIQLYFIDFGHTELVNFRNEVLLNVEMLSEIVYKYPPQALKVRINIQKIPLDFIQRARKLMDFDQKILVKIANFDNENVAWVEFFKRSAEGGLFSINTSIALENELQNMDSSYERKITKERKLKSLIQFNENNKNVPSGGSLKKPNLPKKTDYFNVSIPFAVNPWNFFVQPLESMTELNELMREMQERYKNENLSPPHIDGIIPGQIYASKYDDGKWYRTCVLKVIHSGSISVFFCDFGYYTSLTLNQLIPLDTKFMNLPYQALKAKLAGVKPIKDKWTVEDCENFKQLVRNRNFVSVLIDIEKDELYRSDIILKLALVNTDGEEDVNIKDLLIQQGVAISV